jgi:uncharacterized protein YkwD
MARRSSLLCVAAAVSALAVTACSGSTEFPGGPSDPALDAEENDAVYELNRRREDAGIAATFTVCTSLNKSASAHSDDMRDKSYLDATGLDGSTVRTRACKAGYTPGCSDTSAMAELVGSGLDTGKDMATQWATGSQGGPVILDPTLTVIGIGRSVGENGSWWTLDLGASSDPSCQ